MPITPLDINVSVNKLPEVLRAQQEQANKGFINSSNGEAQLNKKSRHDSESVNSASKDQKLSNDSKHGGGHHSSSKKKKKHEDETEEGTEIKKEHFIDIRI